MAKNDKKDDKKETKSTTVKMYRPSMAEAPNGETMIYGRKAEKNDNGHFFITIPKNAEKNELKRNNPLMTEKQYKFFLEMQQEEEENEEE